MTSAEPVALQAGSVAWWHRRYTSSTRRRPRVDGLTLDKIMAAALGVLDRDGLDALSMRRLADELGTTHTSLYRHVASRDELLVEVVDHVLGDLRADPTAVEWRDEAAHQARELRRVLIAHPALVPLLGTGQLLGPNAMRARERAVRVFLDAGASDELAVHAYLLIAHFVIGTAMLDTGGAARTRTQRAAMTRLFTALPAHDYPTVVAVADVLNVPDRDAEFEFGLQTLLDGLAARIAAE